MTFFSIGAKDLSRYFHIAEELYKRDEDVKVLLQSFERACKGASELLLIYGYAGVGKTSLVNEIHKPVVRGREYFI